MQDEFYLSCFFIEKRMYIQTKAIVLSVSKYGDSAQMVNTYTEKKGRMSFAVKISHSKKRSLTSAYFLPLTILDIEFDYRPKQSVQYIKDCKLSAPYHKIPFDAIKNSIAYFVVEVLQKTLRIDEENYSLFLFIEKSLFFLDSTNENCANFHLIFLLELSIHLGFAPNLTEYENAKYFDLHAGEFVKNIPPHTDFLQREECDLLYKLSQTNYTEMYLLKMSNAERKAMLQSLLRYYQIHLPDVGEFRTLPILEMLFR